MCTSDKNWGYMVIINDFGFLTWSMHKYAHTPYKLNYIITWPICFSQWIFILSSPPANHKIDIWNSKTILRAWNRHSIYWYWVCTFLRQELLIGLSLSYSKWGFKTTLHDILWYRNQICKFIYCKCYQIYGSRCIQMKSFAFFIFHAIS